jgi:hypothetical protein
MTRSIRKFTAASLMCVGLVATGGAAFAQDTVTHDYDRQTQTQGTNPSSSPNDSTSTSTSTTATTSNSNSSSKHQIMKDCVARERAGDSTLSESDAKKACHNAMKAQRDNQDNDARTPQ